MCKRRIFRFTKNLRDFYTTNGIFPPKARNTVNNQVFPIVYPFFTPQGIHSSSLTMRVAIVVLVVFALVVSTAFGRAFNPNLDPKNVSSPFDTCGVCLLIFYFTFFLFVL